jgi:uncharacterized protein (DUF924 family)
MIGARLRAEDEVDALATAAPEAVLRFWFDEIDPAQWWSKNTAFDRSIRERFGRLHEQAARCELFPWRATAGGRLAEVIVLDQFSRNIFRDAPGAFAQDPLALALAQEAVAVAADRELPSAHRTFFYMPFIHSESLAIHDAALPLFRSLGVERMLDFARRHRVIIERFGRYPHRNAILGRPSTDDEVEFLKGPDSGF